jgi:hypothetical protein
VQTESGWDHSACESHQVRVWESRDEVKALPTELQSLIIGSLQRLDMSETEAKNSARQGNSSESSPLPSGEAESTASTQTGTPSEPRGTSPQPSTTP